MSGKIGLYKSKLEIMNLFCNKHGMTRYSKNGKRWKCCECTSDISYERKNRQKQRAIDYKGGCCMKCGYKDFNSALHFHHRKPEEKNFNLTKQNLSLAWDKLTKELDKCDLLCIRCHYEEHATIDLEERTKRKEAMRPNKTMHRKEIHRFNCKILSIKPSL